MRIPRLAALAPDGRASLLRRRVAAYILNHMVQYTTGLDSVFNAVADGTRRGILERLGRREASISELAEQFGMTLTGMKKHVQLLENAGLVRTRKVGRVRTCTLGTRRLTAEAAWIAKYHQMLEAQLDSLGEFLERTRGDQP
jgi:DNA-binding transcriptional ArsR family regulator